MLEQREHTDGHPWRLHTMMTTQRLEPKKMMMMVMMAMMVGQMMKGWVMTEMVQTTGIVENRLLQVYHRSILKMGTK